MPLTAEELGLYTNTNSILDQYKAKREARSDKSLDIKEPSILDQYKAKREARSSTPDISAEEQATQEITEQIAKHPRFKGYKETKGHIAAGKAAYNLAVLGMKKGKLGYLEMMGQGNELTTKQILELTTQQNQIQKSIKDSPYVAKSFGTIAPYIKESMLKYGKGYLWGYMIGGGAAAIAGQLGPQAALPEELATVPLVGHIGGQIGGMFSSLENMRQIEAGGFYLDSLAAGVDSSVAKKFAIAYSSGSTVLEAAQLKLLGSLIPGGKQVASKILSKAMVRMVANKSARALATPVVAATGEATVEATQELLGNFLHIVEAEASDHFEGTKVSEKDKRTFTSKLTDGVVETFATTVVGFGVAGVPGAGVNIVKAAKTDIEIATLKKALKKKAPKTDALKPKKLPKQPSIKDLEKGEQRDELTKKEQEQEDKAIKELGLAEVPVEEEVAAPEEAAPKFKYSDLTQPAVRDRKGKVYTGDKTKSWAPSTITNETSERVRNSIKQAETKAGDQTIEHGFLVGDTFITARDVAAKRDIAKLGKEKKLQKAIETEEKAAKKTKEQTKVYEEWKAQIKELTPTQQSFIAAVDKIIQRAASGMAQPGIDVKDLEQVGRETAIEFVRSGKTGKFSPKGPMRNFINKQLTKGTASRRAQVEGKAPRFEDLDEVTGTTKRKPEVRLETGITKEEKKPRTMKQLKLERAIEKTKKQLVQANAATKRQEDLTTSVYGVARKGPEFSVPQAIKRIAKLKEGLGKVKSVEAKTKIYDEINRISKVMGFKEPEGIDTVQKEEKKLQARRDMERYRGIIAGKEIDELSIDIETVDNIPNTAANNQVIRRVVQGYKESPYRKLVKAITDKLGTKIIFAKPQEEKTSHASYFKERNVIEIYPTNFIDLIDKDGSIIKPSKDPNYIDRVVVHEVLHALTLQKEFIVALVPALQPFINSLKPYMKTAPELIHKALKHKNSVVRATELLSYAFTNVKGAEWLASIEAPKGTPKSVGTMWSWLKNIIAEQIRSFGFPTKLDELTSIMDTVIPEPLSDLVIDENTFDTMELNADPNSKGLIDKEGEKTLLKVASEGFVKSLQKTFDWIDIEAPWKRIGAHKTGLALKTFFSAKTAVQVEGTHMARNFVSGARNLLGKISKEEWADIVFQAENPKHIDTLEGMSDKRKDAIRETAERLDYFFGAIQGKYKERGIKLDWQKRMMQTLEEKLAMVDEADAESTEQIEKIQEKIEKLKGTRFVHVPIQIFFEKAVNKALGKKKKAKNKLILNNLLATKKRHILRIKDIVDRKNSPLKKTDINPVEIMMNYMYRVSKDMAMLDLKDAMLEDKLIKLKKKDSKKPQGMIKGKLSFGVLSNYYMKSEISDMITELLKVSEKQGILMKAISLGKMAAFFNPIFLPMYDVMQSGMSGALFVAPGSIGGNIGRAFNHVFKQDDTYLEAMRLGLFSKPFDFPWKTYKNTMASIRATAHVPGLRGWVGQQTYEFLRKSIDLKRLGPIGALYNASWNMAWKLDETVRMFTYLQLQKGKHSKESAAQTAALFHGDYASVPPVTRQKLNRVFFTPTFKIVMGKLYVRMLKQVLKATIDLPGGKTDILRNAHKRQLLLGAATVLVINYGFDAFIKSFGLEPEDDEWYNWGRRYTQKTYGKYGPREFVLNWSHPGNMPQRYFQKFAQAWKYGRKGGVLKSVLGFVHWDLHPFYTTAWSLIINRKPNGDPIWNENDDDWRIGLKQTRFALTNIIRLGGLLEQDDPLSTKEAKKHINRQWGQIGNILLTGKFSVAGAYTRSPKIMRFSRELSRMNRQFSTTQRMYFMKNDKINREWIRNYIKRINEMLKEGH